MTVKLAFSGIMLLCFGSIDNCELSSMPYYKNTAFVVDATQTATPVEICGWHPTLPHTFTIVLDDFRIVSSTHAACRPGSTDKCELSSTDLPDDLCIAPQATTPPEVSLTLPSTLLQAGDLDCKRGPEGEPLCNFISWKEDALWSGSAISHRIHFPAWDLRAGTPWVGLGPAWILWKRSNGFVGDGKFHDRHLLTQTIMAEVQLAESESVRLFDCKNRGFEIVAAPTGSAEIQIHNRIGSTVGFGGIHVLGPVTDLLHVLYYNQLANWRQPPSGCPTYPDQAVLLRCPHQEYVCFPNAFSTLGAGADYAMVTTKSVFCPPSG